MEKSEINSEKKEKNNEKDFNDSNSLEKEDIPKKKTNNFNKYNAEIMNLPNDFSDFQINFKVIVIGNSGVGKTCITNQAAKNKFSEDYQATLGMEFFSLFIKINNKIVKLQIWDTCGQEAYHSLITNFYRNSSLAILVYSIEDKSSFIDLDLWVRELKLFNCPDTKLILVGNKKDLENERKIFYEEGKKFAKEYGFIDFFETSAKTGENIKEMFLKATNYLYEEHIKYVNIEKISDFATFREEPKTKKIKKKKNSCC